MPASPFDSAHLSPLFPTGETARLFSDSAEVRAMMLVEGTLAKVQGAHGVIPEISAAAIHRASLELQIDPGGLAKATGENGVSTPAVVAAFRELMQAPEHAQYLHWGATSQDIQDTALMLRLRQALGHAEQHLGAILSGLASLAEDHAHTPMAARTYGQHATPTTFGAQVAQWGWPLVTLRAELADLRETCLLVSLSGAAGTASVLGPDPAAIRKELAEKLGLGDPQRSWHTDRTPILRIAGWMSRAALACGKMGQDLILATQSGIGEVILGGTGASSTMPQKQNPVAPSVLKALAAHAQGLQATLQGAAVHGQQRDGAAWFTEWLTLPQLVLTATAALTHAAGLAQSIRPNAQAMHNALDGTGGLILAEALSFALAEHMPRPEAQAATKTLCAKARETGTPLEEIALAAYPALSKALFETKSQTGTAPEEARAFAAAARG
ncbi:class-II fumarase/aspartase family protein [Pacificoceanicola onchidii]|uniref:class-II fumarase/aspartase family protein n=1 Tax=Pacificoceanicola onchidii TaxID=2562685 RepID=UPI0010A507D6|nr:adenylosuccinate lyase family protein [Pacificoceanicola onchidii]